MIRLCFIDHQGTKEGAGLFLLDAAEYLRNRGVQPHCILRTAGPLLTDLETIGVRCRVVPHVWWTGFRTLTAEDYRSALTSGMHMGQILEAWGIQVVYTNTIASPAGAFAAALAGLPHIWHIHEFAYTDEGVHMALPIERLAALIRQTSNLVYFNSACVQREWENHLQNCKTRIVRNWVRPLAEATGRSWVDSLLTKKPGLRKEFLLTQVGSILRVKRQLEAVQAVARLRKSGHHVSLLLVGRILDQDYAQEIRDYMRQEGLQENVLFLGFQEPIMPLFRVVDATLSCCAVEGYGRATIESLVAGVPVIGANAGGSCEVIEDGVSGLLYQAGDSSSLAAVIARLLQDSARRQVLRKGASAAAARFSDPDVAMEGVLEDVQQLASARNPTWPVNMMMCDGLRGLDIFRPKRSPLVRRLRGLIRRHGRRLLGTMRLS